MRVVVITPPDPVVAIDDAKAHLRVDDDGDDTLITAMVAAATGYIDGPDGWLGRALGPQQLEARFDAFGYADHRDREWYPLLLPCPPIVSIVSVEYVDQSGVAQTADPATYEMIGAEVSPVYGAQWPQTRWQREAVRIRYQAGYVVDPTADPLVAALPAPIRAAILLMVGDLYSNRETTLDGRATNVASVPMSTTVENLLAPYRIWR